MKPAKSLSKTQLSLCYVRSILFYIAVFGSVPIWAPVMYTGLLFSVHKRNILSRLWASYVIHAAKYICGLDYRVEGKENIPQRSVIYYSKHQSAWEVVGLTCELPPMITYILKRELLKIPIIGWGLLSIDPIAIDRGDARAALKQVIEQGKQRFEQGISVVIFPEGTRVAPGQTVKYQSGGALLSKQSGTPLLPVALNTGEFWSRNSILKTPGTITVKIGTIIEPGEHSARELNELAKQQIEAMMEEISST